ncbi:hypothetical protein HY214_04590, partial [Candidatus Roizmanbacteria bacterium]|nr:hypothetical protein [Candidatus Roizmanbacteria bacterium]
MILAFLFITWRLCDWLIAFFATRVIPYLGFFAYPKDITHFHLPAWLYSFANFDGAYYLRIATHGYSQFEQAFFPLYPLLLNFLSPVFLHNKLLTGLIISYVCFFFGLIIFKKYLDIESEDIHSERSWEVRSKASTPTRVKNAISSGLWKDKEQGPSFWTVIFLLTFPTSFFFGAVYTEGLFFLLLVLAFYFLARKHYLAAAAVSFLAGLTRLNGALLIIPFFITLLDSARNKKSVAASLFLLFSPLAGVAAYSFYLYKTTGDFFFWLTVQPQFGANRSNHLVLLPQVLFRYLKILFTASHNFQYFISVL